MPALDQETIRELIATKQLITGLVDPKVQISPNGVELTLHKLFRFSEKGMINFSNEERHIPAFKEVKPTENRYVLEPGPYLAIYNETLRIPIDLIAIGRPRSSLLRSGVTIESAVWDAGYEGRSRGLLIVFNPHGFVVTKNARLLHLVFFRLHQSTDSYQGIYQGEM